MLDQYVATAAQTKPDVFKEWSTHQVRDSTHSDTDVVFTHSNYTRALFKFPIPLREGKSSPGLLAIPPYLVCSTTTGSFSPTTVLEHTSTSGLSLCSALKVSVFSDRIFQRGPRQGCPILLLQQSHGAFAGFLRLMSMTDHIDESTGLELVAISTGSAKASGLRQSLEWQIFETGADFYNHGYTNRSLDYEPTWINSNGRYALIFDVDLAFDPFASKNELLGLEFDKELDDMNHRRHPEPDRELALYNSLGLSLPASLATRGNPEGWFRSRNLCRRETKAALQKNLGPKLKPYNDSPPDIESQMHGETAKVKPLPPSSAEHQQSQGENEMICEVYNVLWIKQKDGISYRRACRWVPKHVWKANASGPVEVKLG